MPVYEFECRDCMLTYNKEIDKLVKNLNKKYAEKLAKKNTNFKYIELLNPKNDKTIFSVGKEGNKGIRRFRYKLDEKKFLYLELIDFKFSELFLKVIASKIFLVHVIKIVRILSVFFHHLRLYLRKEVVRMIELLSLATLFNGTKIIKL